MAGLVARDRATANPGAAVTLAISITQAELFTALGQYLSYIYGLPVDRGFENNVAEPVGPYVRMSPVGLKRLSTNVQATVPNGSAPPVQIAASQSIERTVQFDFFGPLAEDYAAIFSTAWRDSSAVDWFTTNAASVLTPLFNDDPVCAPLVNGENLYEFRYLVRAYMQYNPVVTQTQDFFTSVVFSLVDVDATIPI